MNILLETLTYLVFSAIIFGIIWYIVVLIIRRFLYNNKKSTNKSELQEDVRSNYELLLILKIYFLNNKYNISGLCYCVSYLYHEGKITTSEKYILKELLIINKPEKAKLDEYWWNPRDINSRFEFLNKLIEKYNGLKNETYKTNKRIFESNCW